MMTLQKNQKGFTLVEIMIVVAIIGLLAALAIPNFIKARNRSRDSICVNNMKVIASAIEQVTMEMNLNLVNAVVVWEVAEAPGTFGILGPTSYLKVAPICPILGAAGAYTAAGDVAGSVQMTDSQQATHSVLSIYNVPNGFGNAGNVSFTLQ